MNTSINNLEAIKAGLKNAYESNLKMKGLVLGKKYPTNDVDITVEIEPLGEIEFLQYREIMSILKGEIVFVYKIDKIQDFGYSGILFDVDDIII